MRFSVWSEEEQRILSGLPWMQRCLYMVLRWHMDIKTCRVGTVRGISYKSLSEELYVDPAPGRRDSGAPSEKAIRHALEQLEKVGLIKSIGSATHLVFELVVARALARQKIKGQERGRVSGHLYQQPESLDWQWFEPDEIDSMRHPENGIKGHTSEIRVNPLSVETTSSSDTPVGNFSDRMMMKLSADQAVSLVAWLERKRGKVSPLVVTDPVVVGWVTAMGITGLELSEAHRLAVANRRASKCESSVNARFLDSILRTQVLSRRPVYRGVEAEAPSDWFNSEAGVMRMGESVGLPRLAGEPWQTWRLRINGEIDQRVRAERAERLKAGG